ncbi:MAG: sigma 54-interacting transcriptional regulator [Vicinamibacterales bacterium]|jgi:two-component system nitrogen regulation response regulator NtrX|nr:sigma 54-interacting transcriptional regulator [Vicinamibacterales bacterium]
MIPNDVLAPFSLVSESPAMREVLTQVGTAAASPAGVMLTGERGTGRGLIARAIHACAHPGEAPFVAVDCRVLLPAESERALFGVPANGGPGTAVGAPRTGPGVEVVHPGSLLHAARGGTMVFRNLDELPVRVQARLATLFRDREFKTRSNGGVQLFPVRPVAVVEPPFHALVDEGRVRPDLYRRFAEFRIQLPSLRERREDIPALAQLFVSRACRALSIEDKIMDVASQTVLAALPWHGNVREMKDLLESLVQATPETTVSLRTLLEHITLGGPEGVHTTLGVTLREARLRFEREYISAVVAQHHGRIPDAAKALGIQRTNLYRKLRALKLSTPDLYDNGAGAAGSGTP